MAKPGYRGRPPASPTSPFGEQMRRARRARNLTLAALAEATGLSVGYLSRLETGDATTPSEEAVASIARALGLNEAELRAAAQVSPAAERGRRPVEPEPLQILAAELAALKESLTAMAARLPTPFPTPDELAPNATPGRHPASRPPGEHQLRRPLNLAKEAHQRGDLNAAAARLRLGLGMLRELPETTHTRELEIELLYRLADVTQDLRHSSAALRTINQAIALRAATTDATAARADLDLQTRRVPPMAELYRARATIHAVLGLPREAEADFAEALALATDPALADIRALVLNSRCWFLMRQGRHDEAQADCEQSLFLKKQAEKAGARNRKSQAYAYRHLAELALIHHATISLSRAPDAPPDSRILWRVRKAVELFEAYGDARNAAEARLTLAAALTRIREFGAARENAAAAAEYGERFGVALLQVRAHRQLGETLAAGDNLEGARRHLERSLRLTKYLEDPYEVAVTKRVLGVVLTRLGQESTDDRRQACLARAKEALHEAEALFVHQGADWEREQTRERIQALMTVLAA